MRLIAVLSLLVTLSFTPAAFAQEVTPAGRIVVIDQGKSAVVTVEFDDGCKPTWTAVSGNEKVATVNAGSTKGSAKRKFKIKAAKDSAPIMTTVTLSAMGVGGGDCEANQDVVITVVIVRSEKHAVSMAGKAAKTQAKSYAKTRKLAEKQFKSDLTQLLDDLEIELASINGDAELPSLPEQRAQAVRNTLVETMLLYMVFLSNIVTGYHAFALNANSNALSAISSYGYLPFIAATLLIGGGGIWDAFLFKLIAIGLTSGERGYKLLGNHFKKLALIATIAGVPFTFGLLNFGPKLCFPSVQGPGNSGFDLTMPDPMLPTLTARDFATPGHGMLPHALGGEEGSFAIEYELQLLALMPFNHYVDGTTERYVIASGLASTDEIDVDVNLVGAEGTPLSVPIGFLGQWTGLVGGELSPGPYIVLATAAGSGESKRHFVDLSAH